MLEVAGDLAEAGVRVLAAADARRKDSMNPWRND